ncbi:hypothetical protein [Ruegeria sp. YS9]|jgi:hypothetical protein|uniref:hypothetical protein n=1 Tax=Ruegeria sp. YS9 TaxID=2966453 RepID=UPI00214CF3A5|nr:hypothetical protein [Ruegeria sp. YS9]UUV08686.1 hypothetical protein NOR97_20900 [Ruegeria sp. YS9]
MLETEIRPDRGSQPIDMMDPNQAPVSKTRLHAEPIKRILDRSTGEVVGWLYEWNTGSQVPMWKDGRKTDVVYE